MDYHMLILLYNVYYSLMFKKNIIILLMFLVILIIIMKLFILVLGLLTMKIHMVMKYIELTYLFVVIMGRICLIHKYHK